MQAKIKSFLKGIILKMKKRPSHLKVGLNCNHVWYGDTYGGFYVCPDLLNESSIVYSFGIGEDISFDVAMSMKHDCHIFCFDPTPKSINWFKKQKTGSKFHFYEYGIGDKNELVNFYLPKNTDHVSGSAITQKNIDMKNKISVEMKSLSNIMNELGHKYIDILKMDIEGSEYDVLDNILNEKIPITQILIEFHDRLFEDGTVRAKKTIDKLKDNGYEIFAISQSNEEISFVKKQAAIIKL